MTARELRLSRMRDLLRDYEPGNWPLVQQDDLEALLADSDALAAAEARIVHLLQRDEWAASDRDALRAQVATLRPWALFGAWAFEEFWHDSEPGDIDGADAQEKAVECGLLARTSVCDAGATHAEGCDWQPGMPNEECCCYSPCKPPLAATAPEQGQQEGM